MFSNFRLITVISLMITFISNVCVAEVYKWIDDEGTAHYTTQAPHTQAKPVDLPPIMRAEVKIPKEMLVSCDNHGGIDCSAGADQDGSVVCQDGFKGATTRYRFSCNSPKLSIAEISDVKDDGGYSVIVRNAKGVEALNTALFLRVTPNYEIKLTGPETVEAFGVAEYTLTVTQALDLIEPPKLEQLRLVCKNCP